jgi:lactoylglutathione lyase
MKLDHLVIYVSQLDASTSFYEIALTALGFTRSREWVWVNDDGVAIDVRQATSDIPYDRYGAGLNHLGFSVDSLGALEAFRESLTSNSLVPPETQLIAGASCIFLPDPDGLRLEVSCVPAEV